MSPKLKSLLWRVVYAVLLIVILAYVIPLLLELIGMPIPAGPAILLLRFCFGALIILYIIFGPDPPSPF